MNLFTHALYNFTPVSYFKNLYNVSKIKATSNTFATFETKLSFTFPREIEILGWYPVGSVLPYGNKVPHKPWLVTLLVMMLQ